MKYAIITNPVSGNLNVDQKRSRLAGAAKILNAEIHGLDTGSVDEFFQCARELAPRCDVLVAAGGDGTLSDVIHAVDTRRTPVAFLPLGTGNAMGYALNYRGNLTRIARRIRDSRIREYDLIDCDGKARAFMASVGIEGAILQCKGKYTARRFTGFAAYFMAVFHAYFKQYKRFFVKGVVDGSEVEVRNLLSLMVVKQPYYGFGMKVVPEARLDDGRLHLLFVNSGFFESVFGGITAFTVGNRIGHYRTGRQLDIKLGHPATLQFNGNVGWAADAFTFTVLPGALKIKC
ncbi:MAG: diacylglycerol kinase family protein [Pseudomonadota bacterium]